MNNRSHLKHSIRHKVKKIGMPPGTLMYTGDKKSERIRIKVFDYNENEAIEKEHASVEECFGYKANSNVTWINIDGVHDTSIMEKIGKQYDIHPLIQEDIVTLGQRAKIEDMGSYTFMVMRMLYFQKDSQNLMNEQVSIILGHNFLITFQEKEGDVFDAVRERIRQGKGRIRKGGADYLAYSLLDAITDQYFLIVETIGDRIESLEDEMIANPNDETLKKMYKLKSDMIFLNRSVWPLRTAVHNISRGESALVQESTKLYFRDAYDHIIQVIDTIETYRQVLSEMVEIYLSSLNNKLTEVNNKMNEVMKVLTVVTSIFVPLSFLTGVWGMNFHYMPEIEWKWGYPMAILSMVAVGLLMAKYFKDKKWL